MMFRFPLRYQLLLVSLCLLVLPLGAWQYLKAVDYALRTSQEQTLKETALQLARRLSSNPDIFSQPYIVQSPRSNSVYAHPLSSSVLVDGYGDEWRHSGAQIYSFGDAQLPAQLQLGVANDVIYLFLQVQDQPRQYFNPLQSATQGALHEHDYVEIKIYSSHGEFDIYRIRTSAPGTVLVQWQLGDEWVTDNRMRGIWRESAKGYQLELAIEKDLLVHGFSLSVASAPDAQHNQARYVTLSSQPVELAMLSSALQQQLSDDQLSSVTLKLVSSHYWLLAIRQADSPSHLLGNDEQEVYWLVEWLYRQFLLSGQFFVRDSNPYLSYESYPELPLAAQQGVALQWYRKSDGPGYRRLYRETLASAAAPIIYNDQVLAYVVVEKATDQLIALTTSAFGVLFFYTVGASLLVALILLLYASWLSMRVSRLSRTVINAVNEQGKITLDAQRWPDSRHADELGDLSRSYQQLLQRVHDYNDYLRTLSSKLSHELRTPIAVIKSSLENLEETGQADHTYCQRAYEGLHRLNHILNAMSAATRLENSLQDAELEAVSMNDFVDDLIHVYSDVYPIHQLIFCRADNEVKCLLSRELFVQMLDKLVDNAVSFSMPKTPIIVRLEADDASVVLSVENQGVLLPDHMQQSLFEPMISVRQYSQSEGEAHLGMGLYMVRMIAQLHHASVFADNLETGNGVVFSVQFPLHSLA